MIRKALVIPESVTLAHVIRAIGVGTELSRRGVDVRYAFDSHFDAPLSSLHPASRDLPRSRLRSISPAEFNARVRAGRFPYEADELCGYVDDEAELLCKEKPDVVIGDFRLSLLISAKLSGVSYWNIVNAHWLPELDLSYPIQGTRIGALFPRFLSAPVSKLIFRKLCAPFDQALKSHEMEPLGDLRSAYTAGDRLLLADPPGWVPLRGKADPKRMRFIGPIDFTPETPLPPWWDEARASEKLALVNLGSSGAATLVGDIAVELRKMGYDVVASGIKDLPASLSEQGIRFAPLLPSSKLVDRAKIFVCNGGSPNIHLALKAACPVLGIVSNYDQALAMSVAEWNGIGRFVWASQCGPSTLRRELSRLLEADGLGSRLRLAKERANSVEYPAALSDLLAE